jgi:dihydroorotate dehydrogenase electron transfer subunit
MIKKSIFKVLGNKVIANKRGTSPIYKMVLAGDVSTFTAPGQFANIELPDRFLRRPISVCDIQFDKGIIILIYKVIGAGTEQMTQIAIRNELNLLTGLGNGFDTNIDAKKPLLVGGGVGCPPLYYLAKCLIDKGLKPVVILGFNSKEDIFLRKDFLSLGLRVFVATLDGSFGTKGFVTDIIKQHNLDFDYFFACGPLPMLKALHNTVTTEGQLSFEERMGCGFGGCMGCTCKTKNGYKRICKEGPVLKNSEVLL